MSLIITIAFVVLSLLLCIWLNRESVRLYMKLGSCFHTVPIVEHVYRLFGGQENLMNVVIKAGDHALANDGLSSYWRLNRLYIIIANADDANFILKKHLEKDEWLYSKMRLLLRNSLLCAPVHIWRVRRKAIASLLSQNNVLNVQYIFAKLSNVLADNLAPKLDGKAFCIGDYSNTLTFDITCQAILGLDVSSLRDPEEPLRKAINFIMDSIVNALVWIPVRFRFIRRRIPLCRIGRQHKAVIYRNIDQALAKYQQERNQENSEIIRQDDAENISLLSLYRFSRHQLELPELHEEALLLLFAATDTTSVSLSFAILMIAYYPDVQAKAYQEISEVFEKSDRLPTAEDILRLRYLDAVVKESMRLYPVAPVVLRQAACDVTLPSGLKVKKGTSFLLHLWAIHRDPKSWGPDADQFRPERFLEGNSAMPFLAFTGGPRGCPGVQFAMMAIKTALVTLLRRYQLLPGNDAGIKIGVETLNAKATNADPSHATNAAMDDCARDPTTTTRFPRLVTYGLMTAHEFPIRLSHR